MASATATTPEIYDLNPIICGYIIIRCGGRHTICDKEKQYEYCLTPHVDKVIEDLANNTRVLIRVEKEEHKRDRVYYIWYDRTRAMRRC